MVEPAGPFTLVSLEIDQPVLFGGPFASGRVTFSGPAPPGISIALASSDPNILGVDPTVGAESQANESDFFVLRGQNSGKVVITATFGNSVQAEVTVEKDPKEGKEGKEGKDNSKEGKEHHGKELEDPRAYGSPAMTAGLTAAGNLDSDGQAGNGRAFIRSDERPSLRLPVNPDKKKSADAGHRRQPL
jgi:hypothetical protein